MLLASIPVWAYIVAVVIMELLAFWWYRSSVKRAAKEGVSIKFEKATFIIAIVVGILGLVTLIAVNLAFTR